MNNIDLARRLWVTYGTGELTGERTVLVPEIFLVIAEDDISGGSEILGIFIPGVFSEDSAPGIGEEAKSKT